MGRTLASPLDDPNDPLSLALRPPPNETAQERIAREKAEAEARRISDEIDEELRKEREGMKKGTKRPVKLLLLGQSESGKTATLKNFQLTYAYRSWTEERLAWKSIIYFNLIRNVSDILTEIAREMTLNPPSSRASLTPRPSPPASGSGSTRSKKPPQRPAYDSSDSDSPISSSPTTILASTSTGRSQLTGPLPLGWSDRHRVLQLRLTPLRRIQSELEQRLGAGSTELTYSNVNTAAPFDPSSGAGLSATPTSPGFPGGPVSGVAGASGRRVLQEFSINSSNGWKSALEKIRSRDYHHYGRSSRENVRQKTVGEEDDLPDEAADVLASCRDDIKALWEDSVVREMLGRRKTRIEDGAGFFLNDVDRIASPGYQPSDDDIVRARLRTLGVQEYKFIFEHGRSIGQEWRLYDVGGTRSHRAAWYPYFDDVDAIIFLAPISCFDEKLIEDRKVNRLEDSFLLWRSVCSCKLLARTQIILFLNKCDLLQAKLLRGVKIKDSVPSYGTRANDLGTATKYFTVHFREIFKQHSPVPRPFYHHLTSVIDTRSTAVTLGVVEESILRDHLKRADLM